MGAVSADILPEIASAHHFYESPTMETFRNIFKKYQKQR